MAEPREHPVLLLFDALPCFVRAVEAEFPLLRADDAAAIGGRAADIRILVTNAAIGASTALIEALPRLELIVSLGMGTDAIDLAVARQRGVTVANTPVSGGDAVADLAIGLMLWAWRIGEADRFVRDGHWGRRPVRFGRGLRGRTCAIAGIGRIGQAVAARARSFGMEIAYLARSLRPELPWTFHGDMISLATAADILVLAMPADATTNGIVDAAVLDALGPGGVLVNVARGQLVDETALRNALAERRIAAAAVDVLTNEPGVPEELAALDNLLVTPHVGALTQENLDEIYAIGLATIRDHAAGRPVRFTID